MEKKTILTPVGRLVGGDPFVGNDTDYEGRPLKDKAGNPRLQYLVYIAIPKADFGPLWADMTAKAKEDFPALTFDANGQLTPPLSFSYKMIDGDSTTAMTNGTRPCDKEGYPGHYVLKFSSGFAPDVYTKGGEAKITVEQKDMLKRGYYIRLYGTISGNKEQAKPGIYLNVGGVELVAMGEEIVSGPDGAAMFGATPAATPAGAVTTPAAGVPIAMPGAPAGPGAPATAVTPAPEFVGGPGAAPVVEKFKNPANGWEGTRDEFKAAGWTDAQIDTLPRV